MNHVVNFLTSHQLADALQISITSSQEEHLLDDVVLIGCHVNQLRTRPVSLILYMFRLHITLCCLVENLTYSVDMVTDGRTLFLLIIQQVNGIEKFQIVYLTKDIE